MENVDDGFNLLLAHMDDNSPVLDGGLPSESAGDQRTKRREVSGEDFYDPSASGNDLAAQGWCVIAPEGKRGDELLGRIQPLIDARAGQLLEPLKIYRVPPRMSAEDAMSWRQDVYNDDDPDLIPRYQLILGDLHEVSYELQAVQMSEGYVGRLAFKDPEGYESYVEKVLRWEKHPSHVKDPSSMFYTVHDGTAATRIGYRGLIEPVVEQARQMRAAGRFNAGDILECGDQDDPTQDELLDAVGDLEASILFSMSHGCGAPRKGWSSTRAQLNGQGAMSFGREGCLPGRDLQDMPFLPGGIWFMFACFGAGTPERSKFHHWLAQLAKSRQYRGRPEAVLKSLPGENQRPFIAALPQAALASSEGPLAFVGHLDLAWTYGFMEIKKGKQKKRPRKFFNVLKSLCRGDRVGVSMLELMRFYIDKNQELTDLYDVMAEARQAKRPSPVAPEQLGHLWMVRQDLSGYILLGDPAARLPLQRGSAPVSFEKPQEVIEIHAPATLGSASKGEEASSFAAESETETETVASQHVDTTSSGSEQQPATEVGNKVGIEVATEVATEVGVEGDFEVERTVSPASEGPAAMEPVVETQTATPNHQRVNDNTKLQAASMEKPPAPQPEEREATAGEDTEPLAQAEQVASTDAPKLVDCSPSQPEVRESVKVVPTKSGPSDNQAEGDAKMEVLREHTPVDEGSEDKPTDMARSTPDADRNGEVRGEVVVDETSHPNGPIRVTWNISWKIR